MDFRTKLLAGAAGIAIAGAGAWYFYFQEEAPPPRVAAPAKPVAAAPKAEVAPKPPEVADDLASLDRAIKASQSRASDLERNVADLQKLVEMKTKQIAELEKKEAAK